MFSKKIIGFIGGGNLAEAVIKGLIASKTTTGGRILVSDRASERLVHIAETYEVKVYNKNHEVARNADVIFITVKPKDVLEALSEIAGELGRDKLLISVAAGITTDAIMGVLKRDGRGVCPVIRAMPNMPVTVMEGVTALYRGEGVGKEHERIAHAVFSSVGKVITIEDERLMDAVTGLSGSGPAYVFHIMEAMAEAGTKAGLSGKDARLLAAQTTLGAARMALESKETFAELIKTVASPGGTTVEGLKKLDETKVRNGIMEAVRAAEKKATEIARGFK